MEHLVYNLGMNSSVDLPRDYPRPQLIRHRWFNLNGYWEFAFDDDDCGLNERWHHGKKFDQMILVPFPYQSIKSGVNSKDIHEIVWYSHTFSVPQDWEFDDLLLHFGAVDYLTKVWVNGRYVGTNRGGHVPFSFNIASHITEGENRVTLRVEDKQDLRQPRGKQSTSGKPVRIYYYCTTGIWQTVWLEPLTTVRINNLKITTKPADGTIAIDVNLHAPFGRWKVELDVLESFDSDKIVAQAQNETGQASIQLFVQIKNAKLWSPESPHLYKLRIRLFSGAQLLDTVLSYTGLRAFELRDGRFFLNGDETFLLMILDQGYWPESYLAAPSDDALRDDVTWIKRFGFNGVRKHQKIENERWLYWCDCFGLLVWEEMPSARAWSIEAEECLLAEWERAVLRDINHPCIVAWVPLVESLGFPALRKNDPGQHAFLEKIVMRTHTLDSSRPVVDNDGWEHTDLTDICTIHDYSQPSNALVTRYAETQRTGVPPPKGWYKDKPLFLNKSRFRGQPIVLSEIGGFLTTSSEAPGKKRDRLFDYYGNIKTPEELMAKYRDLMEGIASLTFLAGVCYTQLTDIEHEVNGLLTYDRKPKVPVDEIYRLHQELFYFKKTTTNLE